jgi:hypothetical protein
MPAASRQAVLQVTKCADVCTSMTGISALTWSRSCRSGWRRSASKESSYPNPVIQSACGCAAFQPPSCVWISAIEATVPAGGGCRSAMAADWAMMVRWPCASINPGTRVAPPRSRRSAPAPAAFNTSASVPTARIRPSRTATARAAGIWSSTVTMSALRKTVRPGAVSGAGGAAHAPSNKAAALQAAAIIRYMAFLPTGILRRTGMHFRRGARSGQALRSTTPREWPRSATRRG